MIYAPATIGLRSGSSPVISRVCGKGFVVLIGDGGEGKVKGSFEVLAVGGLPRCLARQPTL